MGSGFPSNFLFFVFPVQLDIPNEHYDVIIIINKLLKNAALNIANI